MKLTVYIIAFNEAEKIKECITSVLWADEIVVVDSYSTDGTSEIAEEMGAKVHHVDFQGYGNLRNEALKLCSGEWIFSLDSDERCTPNVQKEILELVNKSELDIYRVPRKNFFMGKWIKHSGWYPNFRQPQLFRNGMMSYTTDPVHEGYISNSNKKIGQLNSSIWQLPFKNCEEIISKTNRYSTLGAIKLSDKGSTGGILNAFLHGLWSFLKHYIFKLGFLDGGPGFVIAFANFEGTFYRYVKLTETNSNWNAPKNQNINVSSK